MAVLLVLLLKFEEETVVISTWEAGIGREEGREGGREEEREGRGRRRGRRGERRENVDRYVLGSDTERVKLEGNLKQNNFYSGSLILWTYSRYRLWQVSPHNRDVRPNIYPWPNIQYTLSTKCVSKLNTQHSSPLRKYVHASTYIQGILRTTLLFHATPITPSS